MSRDDEFEQGLQALLDGRPVPPPDGAAGDGGSRLDPLRALEAIARVHRTVLFGQDVPLDRAISTRWGSLEVRSEIGRGASGTVYRAWDTQLTREVALKLFDADTGPSGALEEGRLLARLNHPHIVRVFGADMHDGVAGIWMELLEGETLDEALARDGVFGAEETLLIGLDLARALAAVHAAGLLHRDVKARNVLRERGGRVVLMDLGAGRTADRAPAGGDSTGTPAYMAPEVLAGGPATERSDIYCLGVLLYRLVTRTFPVTAADVDALRSAHAADHRASLASLRPDLPADLVATIERGCHPDPAARYASAAEFEATLAATLQRILSQRAPVVSAIGRVWARSRRVARAALIAGAATLLAAWTAWDSMPGRSGRRALGLAVPPRSPLYLTVNGGLGILRGRDLTLLPHNPATATVIAVSSDLGVRTMPWGPPWTDGGSFRLDGTPVAAPITTMAALCCWSDGATDGQFNYSSRTDSTGLEPIGSRPLAPAGLYRFNRDWSNPQLVFPLAPDGLYYGVSYSARSDSFWFTRKVRGGSTIEQWSRDGKHLSTPVNLDTAQLIAIAVDPVDDTLWALRPQYAAATLRLENFDTSGRHLSSVDLAWPHPFLAAGGAEFEWKAPK